ncbi:AIPR family protein, partial [Campylobacter jejuni]
DEEAEFGRLVTRYANTQNDVSTQDFAFLDAEQHRLKSEIKVMGFEYLLRSGEDVLTESSDKRIDVRSAAIALACAHRDVELSVLVKREISQLFSDRYRTIFNPSTDPRLLVSSVLVNQVVENKLGELEPLTEGVKNGVIIHGKRVISHLILRG